MFLDNPQVVVVLVQIGGDLGGVGEGGGGGREKTVTITTAGHRTINSKPMLLKPFSESSATNPRGCVSRQGSEVAFGECYFLSFLLHLEVFSHKSLFDLSLCTPLHPIFQLPTS